MHSKALLIVETARRWVGTPFMHQGRRIGVGVDCGGLIYCIGEELELPIHDVKNYCRQPDGSLRHILEEQCSRISEVEPGDLLLIAPDRLPQHIALLTFDNTIIHANESRCSRINKVIEHRYADHWRRRTVAAYRLPE